MKNLFWFWGLISILSGCEPTKKLHPAEILSASYSMVTHSEFERGYEVQIELIPRTENLEVKEIIINRLRMSLSNLVQKDLDNWEIIGYLPVQSKLIQNFEPPRADSKNDGIIFEIEGKEYYQEIKFKLK